MRTNKKFYETKSFKQLSKEWDQHLAASGFEDIESASDRESNSVTKQHITVDHSKIAYNEACIAYLESGAVKDTLDAFIFEKHCEGVSSRDISMLLESHGFKALDRRSVDRRILKVLKTANIEAIEMRV
jgi:hypothetical protein